MDNKRIGSLYEDDETDRPLSKSRKFSFDVTRDEIRSVIL